MRKHVHAAVVAIATVVGPLTPALGQVTPPNGGIPPVVTHGATIPPLGWYAIGSIACAAISPMIGTVMLGRELTIGEAYHSTLGCMLGPVGWLIADSLFPPGGTVVTTTQHGKSSRKSANVARGRHFNI